MPAISDHSGDSELMILLCAAEDTHQTNRLFAEIFNRYHARVVTWCFRLTRDNESAADLAQEVMLKAFRHRQSFRGDARLSTWLYAIARNHCLTALKKRAARINLTEAGLSPKMRDCSIVPPDVAVEKNEQYAQLRRTMTCSLEPLEVRVMALHYGYGHSLGEITRDLALKNPSGAKAYIVNGRRKLHGTLRRRGWQGQTGQRWESMQLA